jgi:hypothetical protein
MNNLFNNCKIVNIVWIDRGIILSIIYFILKYYDELVDKVIIITEDMYRIYVKSLFPKLKIEDYKNHKSNNFYFNIKKILRNQDIIIDFVKNYKYSINTSKIYLVPWFNMYDPLIAYRIDNKEKIKLDKYISFINNFSKCSRANYLNNIWDVFMENRIMMKYNKFNPSNSLMNQINLFNQFITKNYQYLIYSSIQYPKVFYKNIVPVINGFNSSIQNNTLAFNTSAAAAAAAAAAAPAPAPAPAAAAAAPAAPGPAAAAPAAPHAPAPPAPPAHVAHAHAHVAHAHVAHAHGAPFAHIAHHAPRDYAAVDYDIAAVNYGFAEYQERIDNLKGDIKNIKIDNKQKMDNLIEILNNKIKLINNLI